MRENQQFFCCCFFLLQANRVAQELQLSFFYSYLSNVSASYMPWHWPRFNNLKWLKLKKTKEVLLPVWNELRLFNKRPKRVKLTFKGVQLRFRVGMSYRQI